MTDLSRLKVSLTKHNAHKVAYLLKKYRTNQVLARLQEVQAEEAQAKKNLSVLSNGTLPNFWIDAKKIGDSAIDALVLISIIFSHHKLITGMINASDRYNFSGRIERNNQLLRKEYTNFVRVIDQLGFATQIDRSGITFDFKGMFEISNLGPLVAKLLEYKLASAGWDRSASIAEESINKSFHQVFGLTPIEFRTWIGTDIQPKAANTTLLPKDSSFFQDKSEGLPAKPFEFKPGHVERAVETISRSASSKTKANQLHNRVQNDLYSYLCSQIGNRFVGTEQHTGCGTSVDIVTNHKGRITFFEIKTGSSVRASIRQAIPQLLEYAYWPKEIRADELIIVSHLPLTKDAEKYLEFLRTKFDIPLFYRQFDLKNNKLI